MTVLEIGDFFYKVISACFAKIPCVIFGRFGFYCPGCGGRRAIRALLSGDIFLSVWYHPLVMYTVIVVSGFLVSNLLDVFSIPGIKGWRFRPKYLYIAVIIVIFNCIFKNILLHGFHITM